MPNIFIIVTLLAFVDQINEEGDMNYLTISDDFQSFFNFISWIHCNF